MTSTTAILEAARAWLDDGQRVTLATVVETWGSAPRRPGAHMVIAESGAFAGSVSGGCVEGAVVEEAQTGMDLPGIRTLEYGVSDDEAWAVGLACGGRVRIALQAVTAEVGSAIDEILQARGEGRAVMAILDLESGSLEVLPGVALDAHPEVAEDEFAPCLRLDQTRIAGDGRYLLRPHNPPARVIVVGAAHLAQSVVRLLDTLQFETVVVDPRQIFTRDERFPGVRVLDAWPDDAFDRLGLDARCAVLALSHDPKLDDPALERALRSEAFYVGALGSRRTHARRLERLADRGLTPEELGRIHAPVGLDIGARSPDEIAVSIVAEIVGVLRGAVQP
jgi:xanthine dehydrogenase accessory factor